MEHKKLTIAWAIRIIVAFLFIISAIAKLYPSPYFAISTFEVKQLYTLGFSESIAPYFSRTLIGIEMALGILLLQNHWLRKFIIPATILLLAVFVGHLTYVTFLSGGNSGNCGCFGELIPMTPIEAIIKNCIAIALLAYLYTLLSKNNLTNHNFWILTTVLLGSILGIYMLAPIQPPAAKFSVSPIEETLQDTIKDGNTTVIDSAKVEIPINQIKKDSVSEVAIIKKEVTEPKNNKSGYSKFFSNIDKNKKLVGFFAPGCEHCIETAKYLTEMRKKDSSLPPLSIIFMNEEADLIPQFFEKAGATYPYQVIEIIPFWTILGSGKDTPGVKYLWNGNDVKFYWGITDNKFNGEELNQYIKKDYSELKKANPKL